MIDEGIDMEVYKLSRKEFYNEWIVIKKTERYQFWSLNLFLINSFGGSL